MNRPIDAELLGRLLDVYGASLALYASQWTDAADDCVQEALVELARQSQVPQHPAAWLYRVVKHRALNAARGARRRRERESRAMAERFADRQRPEAFDRGDALAAMDALSQLDAGDRELVILRVWGSLTYDEVAGVLGISTSSAHRQYAQALAKLRQILESPCSTNANQNELS